MGWPKSRCSQVRTSLRPGESTTFSTQFADVYVVGATQMLVTSLELEIGSEDASAGGAPRDEIRSDS